jgi:hypothetical protein
MAGYNEVSTPPVLDPPTIDLLVGGPGEFQIEYTPNTGGSLFQTEVQFTYIEDDWAHPSVYYLSPDTVAATIPARPNATLWVRARSNDKYLSAVDWSAEVMVATLGFDAGFGYSVLVDQNDAVSATGTVT